MPRAVPAVGSHPAVIRGGVLIAALGMCLVTLWQAGARAASNLHELGAEYHLTVDQVSAPFSVATAYGPIEGRAAPESAIPSYTRILAPEWSLYPPELVARTGLKRLVLCASLRFAGQARTAIPDFDRQTLYLDVDRGRQSDTYVRKVIHHEFFHIIDWRDDGQLYRDDAWAALNPAGFRYGVGGAAAQGDPTTSLPDERLTGFLNRYSTTGVEEDKAEIFAALLVEPRVMDRRAARDSTLRAKVAQMRVLLAHFCPEAGDGFWIAARVLDRAGP